MSYFSKYQKYKTKYLNLKNSSNQIGGDRCTKPCDNCTFLNRKRIL